MVFSYSAHHFIRPDDQVVCAKKVSLEMREDLAFALILKGADLLPKPFMVYTCWPSLRIE